MKFVESLRKLIETFTESQEADIDEIVKNNINSRNSLYKRADKEVSELVNSIKKYTKEASSRGLRFHRHNVELKTTLDQYYSFVVISKLKEALEDNGFDCEVRVGQHYYGALVMINVKW